MNQTKENIEEGYLSKAIKGLRNSAINVMTIIEHELDFVEDEIDEIALLARLTVFRVVSNLPDDSKSALI